VALRTYGRTFDEFGNPLGWQQVTTDANGYDDAVWLTTLCQVLLLNLNESPFYADYGIPAHPSVVQQVFPDFYLALTQARFARYFASLIISKVPSASPVYRVNVVTHQGVQMNTSVPIPY